MISNYHKIALLVILLLSNFQGVAYMPMDEGGYFIEAGHKTFLTASNNPPTLIDGSPSVLNSLKSNAAITAFSILFILFFIIFIIARNKLKKEKILSNYELETKIAKKVHDEIANEIYNTLNYAGNVDLSITQNKEKLIANLEIVYNKTRNISREINNIDIGTGYKEQLKSMLSEYRTNKVNILIKDIDSINWAKISETKKIAAYRALQELMVNMLKHSKASIVVINFKQKGYKVRITYSDNGIGTCNGRKISKNGLLNVENRMDSINGKVIFEPKAGKGFHLTLTYPV